MLSTLDDLESMFEKMNNEGFDTSLELRWGYYFVDSNRDKLETIYSELSNKGYYLEKIYNSDSSDPFWTLHVSKVDILTPEKLYKRNLAFNELAIYCEVELYDGWDVEKL